MYLKLFPLACGYPRPLVYVFSQSRRNLLFLDTSAPDHDEIGTSAVMIGVRFFGRSAPIALKSFPSRIPSAVRNQLIARTYSAAASTSAPSSSKSYSKFILAGVAVAAGSTLFLSTRSPVLAEAVQISEPTSLSTSIASFQTTKSSDRPASSDVLSALRPEVLTDAHAHLEKADVTDLVKQYVVYLLSEQSYLVERGPWMLKQLEWTRDNVPVLGSLVWSAFSFVSPELMWNSSAK